MIGVGATSEGPTKEQVDAFNAANPPDSPQALLGYCSALQGRYSNLERRVVKLETIIAALTAHRPWWKWSKSSTKPK